jgi:hypothetical protein
MVFFFLTGVLQCSSELLSEKASGELVIVCFAIQFHRYYFTQEKTGTAPCLQ